MKILRMAFVFGLISIMGLFPSNMDSVMDSAVSGIGKFDTEIISSEWPLVDSPIEPIPANIPIFEARTSTYLNFSFYYPNSIEQIDFFLMGPLGNIGWGLPDKITFDYRWKSIKFWSGIEPGHTWILISALLKNQTLIQKYLFIQVVTSSKTPTDTAYFQVSHEDPTRDKSFVIQLNDKQKIEEARSILNGKEPKIVNGLIAPGWAGFNVHLEKSKIWYWYMIPETIEFADFTIEVCDGDVTYIQDNLWDWINQVGRYCPWSYQLSRELTYSEIDTIIHNDKTKPELENYAFVGDNGSLTSGRHFTLTFTENIGILGVNASFVIPEPSQVEILRPLQPRGNGKFALHLPQNETIHDWSVSISVRDPTGFSTKSNIINRDKTSILFPISISPSTTPNTPANLEDPNQSPSFSLIMLFTGIISLVIVRRWKKKNRG